MAERNLKSGIANTMHIHFTDPYLPADSPVHRLDARVKLLLTIAFIVMASAMPAGAWHAYILLISLSLSLASIAEVGIGNLLRRSILALPFLLAAVGILFTTPDPVRWHVSLGPLSLAITETGLIRFASIAIKAWIAVQGAVLLSATTPFPDLLAAMQALGVPRLLVSTFSLMWRYAFILVDEALRLARAREARSAAGTSRKGLRWLIWQAQVTGNMAGILFLRGLERGERVYAAMAARGCAGEFRTFPRPTLGARQWGVLILGLLLLSVMEFLAYLF